MCHGPSFGRLLTVARCEFTLVQRLSPLDFLIGRLPSLTLQVNVHQSLYSKSFHLFCNIFDPSMGYKCVLEMARVASAEYCMFDNADHSVIKALCTADGMEDFMGV